MAMRDSSRRWLARQRRDIFVRRARAEHYRSRAAYKLAEIDRRVGLLRRGYSVVDLGAAPGGWSQIAAQRIGKTARIIAVDLVPIKKIDGVNMIQADIEDKLLAAKIKSLLGSGQASVVLSDLAPPTTGHRATDQARIENLTLAAFSLTQQILAPKGDFLVKTRQGGWDDLMAQLKGKFAQTQLLKPEASRSGSAEIYVLARGYQPN